MKLDKSNFINPHSGMFPVLHSLSCVWTFILKCIFCPHCSVFSLPVCLKFYCSFVCCHGYIYSLPWFFISSTLSLLSFMFSCHFLPIFLPAFGFTMTGFMFIMLVLINVCDCTWILLSLIVKQPRYT